MNAIAVTNQTFTIAETVINMVDGLYSLNDLHKASGNESKHQPAFFMRNQETKELIEEIERSANLLNGAICKAVKRIQGGDAKKQGTYVCKEIVYRYAMWISPKFALIVIRAFDAMVTRTDSTQRAVLVAACTKLSAGNMAISDVYKMVGGKFGYDNIIDIPTPLLPEAIAFVYELILLKRNHQPAKDHQQQLYETLQRLFDSTAERIMQLSIISFLPFADVEKTQRMSNELTSDLNRIKELSELLKLTNEKGKPMLEQRHDGFWFNNWRRGGKSYRNPVANIVINHL